MKMFENIKITINTDKAMKIFGGSVNIAAGFVASIGINEIYRRIDKTGVSKVRRYLMDCGLRAVTIAATTPYITAGVKQLAAANSDKEKLITVEMKEKTLTKVPGTPEDDAHEINDEAMMAQKNKIIEIIRGLVAQYGDIHYQLSTMHELFEPSSRGRFAITLDTKVGPAYTESWAEFVDEVTKYNNNMHQVLGDSYEFTTLQNQLIMAADEIVKEMERDLGTADKTQQ